MCANAQKRGWQNCPSKSVPAGEIEQFVVDHVRDITQEPELITTTLEQICKQPRRQLDELRKERSGIESDLVNANAEVRNLVA